MKSLYCSIALPALGLVVALGGIDAAVSQTTQQVTTSSKEYGSSLRAGVRGMSMGGISVGARIPSVNMNQPGGRPSASVRRIGGSTGGGTIALQPQGGINPLLQSGALTVPAPYLGPGSTSAPRPQAYNPYTGQSYGTDLNSKTGGAGKLQAASRTPTVPGHYAFPVSGGPTPRRR